MCTADVEHLVSFSYNGINIGLSEYCIRMFDGPIEENSMCHMSKVVLPRRADFPSIQSMTHDFATTSNYVIIVDSPFYMSLQVGSGCDWGCDEGPHTVPSRRWH
jgi:hypothetical protein